MSIPVVKYSDFSTPAMVPNARRNLAKIAQYAMFAEDMYVSDALDPECDKRFHPNWVFVEWLRTTVAANIIGDIEHWLHATNNTTYFGALFQHKLDNNQYLVAVRGTESSFEWLQDAIALPDVLHGLTLSLTSRFVEKAGKSMSHPDGGFVPAGFYGIYAAMTLGKEAVKQPPRVAKGIIERIAGDVATKPTITIVGHSLGAVICAYLAYDLAKSKRFAGVNAYLYATPNPGDEVFTRNFTDTGVNCVSVAYERDLVPKVPTPPLYVPLAETIAITTGAAAEPNIQADAIIKDRIGCNHHVICYAAMLSSDAASEIECTSADSKCTACIQPRAA